MNKAPVGHSKRTNSRSVLGKSHACGASEALRSSSVVACQIALIDWSLISKKGTRSGEVPRVPHPSRARQVWCNFTHVPKGLSRCHSAGCIAYPAGKLG